jgi:DNA (cytosine-5)-methyltransferase 1
MTARQYASWNGNFVQLSDGMKIRRLTPVECELLQAFPRNWTKYGIIDGKKVEISDSQRYKMCGNALTTTVAEFIAHKLTDTEDRV